MSRDPGSATDTDLEPTDPEPTDLVRVGGPEAVRVLMHDFVHRVASDFIIGFLFEGRDLARIVRHEGELAVAHLGGPAAYGGRPLGAVHRPLRINRGHFRRRLAILRTVLTEAGVSPDVVERWVAHDAALEAVITDGTECTPSSGAASEG